MTNHLSTSPTTDAEFYPERILTEANSLIYGDRQNDYGHPKENFQRIAELWSVVLETPVSMEQVALCMVQLKVARMIPDARADSPRKIKRDSIVDAAGYLGLLERLQ